MKRWLPKSYTLKNLAGKGMVYLLLLIFGFVFIYPLIFIILRSVMPADDMFNPLVNLIPSSFTLENYRLIFSKINLGASVFQSLWIAGFSAVLQTLSCCATGYGLSRFDFKLKKLYMVLIVVCFIIPSQVLMIPTYLGYSEIGIIGSPLAFFIPATLGQGIKSSIFVLIFFSFFNTLPPALDEAAEIDGCSAFGIFAKIALPLSVPGIVLSLIFSVVWYWNETYLTMLYIGESAKTLPSQMAAVLSLLENEAIKNPLATQMNVPVRMAACFMTLIPLLAFYLVLQKQFVESVDKSGITGE